MPRPRKAIDYDDEIMKVEAQLIRCDKTKAELLERRQELLNAKREQRSARCMTPCSKKEFL